MALNKDGLDPSKPVDFQTLMRVKSEQKARKQEDDKPKRKPRKSSTED